MAGRYSVGVEVTGDLTEAFAGGALGVYALDNLGRNDRRAAASGWLSPRPRGASSLGE